MILSQFTCGGIKASERWRFNSQTLVMRGPSGKRNVKIGFVRHFNFKHVVKLRYDILSLDVSQDCCLGMAVRLTMATSRFLSLTYCQLVVLVVSTLGLNAARI